LQSKCRILPSFPDILDTSRSSARNRTSKCGSRAEESRISPSRRTG
jgi:hypothetical protein